MNIDTKFIDTLNFPDDKPLFEVALEILLYKSQDNNPNLKTHKQLSHEEKIKVTKIYNFINKAAFVMKKKGENGFDGLNTALEKYKERNFIFNILKRIEFDKSINNYRLINSATNTRENQSVLYDDTQPGTKLLEFTKLEWKIEIVLSSIVMKKVLRPILIMVIHSRQGRKSFYVDMAQFQELRKNFAMILRQIHQIELRNIQ